MGTIDSLPGAALVVLRFSFADRTRYTIGTDKSLTVVFFFVLLHSFLALFMICNESSTTTCVAMSLAFLPFVLLLASIWDRSEWTELVPVGVKSVPIGVHLE